VHSITLFRLEHFWYGKNKLPVKKLEKGFLKKMFWLNGKQLKIVGAPALKKYFEDYLSESGLLKQGKMQDDEWIVFALENLKARHQSLKAI
jgi:hypothetical protein